MFHEIYPPPTPSHQEALGFQPQNSGLALYFPFGNKFSNNTTGRHGYSLDLKNNNLYDTSYCY